VRLASGPKPVTVFGKPPAAPCGPAPSGCPAVAPRRPAWVFLPGVPVAACRSHSAVVRGRLASAPSGRRAIARLSCRRCPHCPCWTSLACRPASSSLAHKPLPSLVHRSRPGFRSCVSPCAFRSLRQESLELHSAPPRQRPAIAGSSAACRASSPAAYSPLPAVWAFAACATTMPAADFCRTVRVHLYTLSPDSGTCSRPPVIRTTAFNAQPPHLPPAPLMVVDFAIACPLVRRRRPHIRFLFIGSRLCSTLPSDPASRRRPCASLSLLPIWM
jgi:hypothetical protein